MSDDVTNLLPDSVGDPAAFYGCLEDLLAGGERLALCTILRLAGSGPRRAGAKMLFRESGRSVGTVGGGVLEARVTVWAREALQDGHALCRSFAMDLTHAAEDGMTCGGEVEVLVEPLDGSASGIREFFGSILSCIAHGGRAWLATSLRQVGDAASTERLLVADGRPAASLPASAAPLPEDLLRSPAPSAPSMIERGGVRYFVEPLARPITVVVFGGGHIAVRLVPLCHLLGFRTVVVGDRADFASRDRFPQSSDLIVPASPERALQGLPIGEDSYLVIATRGHTGDEAVLRESLRRRPGYVGMIGSRRKRQLIFDRLAGEGFTPDDLARVACPIGLPIGAETPEEIAISIAAQLVAARAARRGKD